MKRTAAILSLCLVGLLAAETAIAADAYFENFNTTNFWAGGTMTSYNTKFYTNNTALPNDDYFVSTSAVRETTVYTNHDGGYSWRLGDAAKNNVYLRYVCQTNVVDFSVYIARWANSPTPNFEIRYSTNSGSTYTTLLATNGNWFAYDKTYKQFKSDPLNIVPEAGQSIYIEVYRSTGERMLVDDFYLNPPPNLPVITITNPATASIGVPNGTAAYDVQGTCNTSVIGQLSWTNTLTSEVGTIDAAASWIVSGISLNIGTNVITVSGTNSESVAANASVTIVRSAMPPTNVQFTASSASIAESGGAYTVTVYKTLADGNVSGEVRLSGTATEGIGADYTIDTTNFTMNGATTSATFVVTINDDTIPEPPETVILALTNVVGGTIASPSVFTLTITDNDIPPLVGDEILAFRFTVGPNLNVSTSAANIAVSPMGISAGTISTNVNTGTYFPNNPYIEASGGWTADNAAAAKNFFFTITPTAGYALSVSGISFRAYASSAGPSAFSCNIASGLATFTVNAPDSALLVVSQDVAGVENQSAAVTVMIQGWTNGSRATSGGGLFKLDDVVIYGSITATNGVVDGIPGSWWDRYGIPSDQRLATNNPDGDADNNYEEYVADTDPTNNTSYFVYEVTNMTGRGELQLLVGPPTTNSRIYDAFYNTNLVTGPWTPYNFDVPGMADGSAFFLTVTNDAVEKFYRTGVKVP